MTPSTHEQLLGWLALLVSNESMKLRESIGTSERLVVLAVLCNWRCTSNNCCRFIISRSTLYIIITETRDAIWTVLMRESFLTCPSMEEEWKEISQKVYLNTSSGIWAFQLQKVP